MARPKVDPKCSTEVCSVAKANCEPDATPCAADASQRQLHAVLDTAVDGIVLIDEHGIIHGFNRAAERMFDYSTAETIGHDVSMLMPPPFARDHNGYLANYLRTGDAKIIGIGREAVGRKKDGTLFPIELAVSEVHNGEGRTFTGIVRDISERKHLEREILKSSEREQRKIGHDLHDGLCQELAGIGFLVQSMQQKLQSNGVVDPSEAATVTELLQGAIRHARGLSHGLYPVASTPNGLAVALEELAATTSDLFKVDCSVHCAKPVEMHDTFAATQVYRIAQEAVRDAIRHGKATRVGIELTRTQKGIEIKISDDGTSLSQDGRLRADNVLWMMQHRARVLGAKLQVRDRKSGGVQITCDIPDKTTP